MPDTLENTMIHLIGFAGAGKRTIARQIADQAAFRLVDSHLIDNVVFRLIHADGKTRLPREVWDRVGEIRSVALQTIREISPAHFSFVFTNEMIEGEARDERTFETIRAVAVARQAFYLPVRLGVAEPELRRRITSPERAELMKVTLEEAAIVNSRQKEVFIPTSVPYFDIDVTDLQPSVAARLILEEAARRRGRAC